MGRILGEAFSQNCRQLIPPLVRALPQSFRKPALDLPDPPGLGTGPDHLCRPAGQGPDQRHAEREEIRLLAELALALQLRGAVATRAAGEANLPLRSPHLRQPEINEHRRPVRHEDVGGLDVPVEHALSVGLRQSLAKRGEEFQHSGGVVLVKRGPAIHHPGIQLRRLRVMRHDEIEGAALADGVFVLAGAVDRRDAGMAVEPLQHVHLTEEQCLAFRAGFRGNPRAPEGGLDHDIPLLMLVVREVDGPHAAGAEFLEDLDGGAGERQPRLQSHRLRTFPKPGDSETLGEFL